MRTPSRLTVVVVLAAVAGVATADPPQLVKPVAPAGGAVRARVPLAEDKNTAVQFKAQIAGPKGKVIAVTVLLESLPQKGTVSLKKWKEWGFEVPANRVGVISELIVPAAQLAPKPTKGRDIELRLPNIKVDIVEPPGGKDGDNAFELFLSLRDLTGGADKAFEPRVYFADKFLELTVPNTGVKRLNAGDATSPDPQATADDKRVAAVGTMQPTGNPVFAFASVNGQTRYTTPTGKVETVNVGVSTTSNHAVPGILMTTSTARVRGRGGKGARPGGDRPGEGEGVAARASDRGREGAEGLRAERRDDSHQRRQVAGVHLARPAVRGGVLRRRRVRVRQRRRVAAARPREGRVAPGREDAGAGEEAVMGSVVGELAEPPVEPQAQVRGNHVPADSALSRDRGERGEVREVR